MNYALTKTDERKEHDKGVLQTAWARLVPLMKEEGRAVTIALSAVFISSTATLVVPIIIAKAVDTYIAQGDVHGVFVLSGLLAVIFIITLGTSYLQIRTMGGVGRRLLFNLRNKIFTKLQELPLAFFNQNKAGDLISRINNDTEKLNQFFAQALMQFLTNIVLIIGTGIFLLVLNVKLGLVAIFPAILALIATQMTSSWIKRANLKNLEALGAMSGEIQESINNFKVIVAFNRLDYFKNKFKEANERNYKAAIRSGVASNILNPIYTFASALAQLLVLVAGIYLIAHTTFTVGLLIGFLLYVNNFYNPLRQLAAVWSSLQLALAGLDRISQVLALTSDIETVTVAASPVVLEDDAVLAFDHVSFHYDQDKNVLNDVSFSLKRGKTYALVGPTGGGKTTTASLMARLYDPTKGTIYLDGKDLRSYSQEERAKKIGFILQEPFLFSGTIKENILYGNHLYQKFSDEELLKVLHENNFASLLLRFPEGLETKVGGGGDGVSLGQKQLIAFIRAALRNPDILILDEATANIDTVTEQLLQEVLDKLPKSTTKVVIAHRLNTIENADAIFFVNASSVTHAGSMQQALDMLLHGKRIS